MAPERLGAVSPAPAGDSGRDRGAGGRQPGDAEGQDLRDAAADLPAPQSAAPPRPRRGRSAVDRPHLGSVLGATGGQYRRGSDPRTRHLPAGLSAALARQVLCHPDDPAAALAPGQCPDRADGPPDGDRPGPLAQTILAKAQGNPFFLEEIAQTLVEQGTLRREGGMALPPTLQLPATVQGVLAARIDRLPPSEKALLQTVAVIGTGVRAGCSCRSWPSPRPTSRSACPTSSGRSSSTSRRPLPSYGNLQTCPHPGGGLPLAVAGTATSAA